MVSIIDVLCTAWVICAVACAQTGASQPSLSQETAIPSPTAATHVFAARQVTSLSSSGSSPSDTAAESNTAQAATATVGTPTTSGEPVPSLYTIQYPWAVPSSPATYKPNVSFTWSVSDQFRIYNYRGPWLHSVKNTVGLDDIGFLPGAFSEGQTFHRCKGTNGCYFDMIWYGSKATWYVEVDNATAPQPSLRIGGDFDDPSTFDGVSVQMRNSTASGVLSIFYTITAKTYNTFRVSLNGLGNWRFYGMQMTSALQVNAPSFDKVPQKVVPFTATDGTPTKNEFFNWKGSWDYRENLTGPVDDQGTTENKPYKAMWGCRSGQSSAHSSPCMITVDIPTDVSMIMINGTFTQPGTESNAAGGPTNFTIIPRPPRIFGGNCRVQVPPAPTDDSVNCYVSTGGNYTEWDALLVMPLDPSVKYQLNITVGNTTYQGFHTMTFFSNRVVDDRMVEFGLPAEKSSNHVGAIAGGVVGGVVGVLIIAGIGYWFWRKRRTSKRRTMPEGFQVDDSEEPVTPFMTAGPHMVQPPHLGPVVTSFAPSESGYSEHSLTSHGYPYSANRDPSLSPLAEQQSVTSGSNGSRTRGSKSTYRPPTGTITELGERPLATQAVHAEDQGRLAEPGEPDRNNVDVLPPVYNPTWKDQV